MTQQSYDSYTGEMTPEMNYIQASSALQTDES